MKKYYLLAKIISLQMLIYRTNFIIWRVRQVLQILIIYYLWTAILPTNQKIGNYDQPLMLTYILTASVIGTIVYASRSVSLGDDINSGNLSNKLLMPISYLRSWFATDMGDKVMNVFLSLVEISILFLLLKPPFIIQTDPLLLFLTFIAILSAIILYFFFNVLLGFIGFWSPEVWAPRFIFSILLTFFAGGLFPLDILPPNVFTIFQYLPFTYLLYFPVTIYLGQLPLIQIVQGILISFMWTIILYLLVQYIWSLGIKQYTAQGR